MTVLALAKLNKANFLAEAPGLLTIIPLVKTNGNEYTGVINAFNRF